MGIRLGSELEMKQIGFGMTAGLPEEYPTDWFRTDLGVTHQFPRLLYDSGGKTSNWVTGASMTRRARDAVVGVKRFE